MERLRKLRADISHHDSAKRFTDELGIDVFIGEAKFLSKYCYVALCINQSINLSTCLHTFVFLIYIFTYTDIIYRQRFSKSWR